jgi:hypothetical protein
VYQAREILDILDAIRPKIMGSHTKQEITATLNRAFKPFDAYVTVDNNNTFKNKSYSMQGWYDPNARGRSIEIRINLNKGKRNLRVNTDKDWQRFRFLISEFMQHELIHKHQWQHREPEWVYDQYNYHERGRNARERERRYLGDKDEIHAYAHDIAHEIRYHYPDEDPYKVLQDVSNRTRKIKSYGYYKSAFRGCEWSAVQQRLIKHAYKWIPHIVT